MTVLGLGTYRCLDVAAAAASATDAGAPLIDTAPVYAGGHAQAALAPVLATHPQTRVSTKVGYMSPAQGTRAHRTGALTASQAAAGHCITPRYVRYQLAVNAAELRRSYIDLLCLHNPEHGWRDRGQLLKAIVRAFAVCEAAATEGRIGGYGVATWDGLEDAFSVDELLAAAREAAGGHAPHLTAVQLPVSLVNIAPIAAAAAGKGAVTDAAAAGLEVWASAPLHGGELPGIVTPELAELIQPGLTPTQAALLVVASTPGLTGVLLSTTDPIHWQHDAAVIDLPSLNPTRLREICAVLDA